MVIAVGVGVTSCGASADDPGTARTPPAPGLERFYDQRVSWAECDSYDVYIDDTEPPIRCARIDVPLDYARPDGTVVQIALSRVEASERRIGSVLMLPGGPGGSGLWMANYGRDTEIAQRFDRIGFDPRGVGDSIPAVACLTGPETDAERAEPPLENTPEGIAAAELDLIDYAEACERRNGRDLLAHLGTREVSQDMDVVRAVLDEERLTAVGYSYGTRLGSAYAERFPQRVRALVLDGAVDPSADPVDDAVTQAAGFQQAFEAFAAACVLDSGCPLGTDAATAVRSFQELLEPLRTAPAYTDDPRGLSYNDAVSGVIWSLYWEDAWETLTAGLAELREGYGDVLLQVADQLEDRRDDGTYAGFTDAFHVIRCVDTPRIHDRAVVARLDAEYRRAAPFLDDGRATGAAPKELCAFWPVPNTTEPHTLSIPDLPRTVVVSTTGDPATPHSDGIALARQLDAALITYEGNQHTVALQGVSCVDDAVIRYLVDLETPADGLLC
ncbi:alpha/beta fold hydrolase [Nocardia sp. NPDC058176]|uniref:alpha/beta fold hydrolase n=1 Tax=Nocardia sp. NPDC058176 TaxID=3346368 RepID=UPI0036DAC749